MRFSDVFWWLEVGWVAACECWQRTQKDWPVQNVNDGEKCNVVLSLVTVPVANAHWS